MKTTPHALFSYIAEAAPVAPATPVSPATPPEPQYMVLIGYALLFAAMYFFLIAPARKAQKEREKLQSQLEVGQEIMTSTGIYGRITHITDSRVTIELDNGKMTIHKSSVASLASDESKVLPA